ncbi:Kelch domain-containing protein 9 [Intoshia linei]|uniref:Kelch domain-containing protein 9 n=1 Tax=Intoshia linei TaxID=1819745 RepID=A0A177B3J8_9BILA|nr:Kelch domain-containing protein 9 [Intoshia linei]
MEFELFCTCGPQVTNHAGCLIGDIWYVYGGVGDVKDNCPISSFYSLNMKSKIWTNLSNLSMKNEKIPPLSHHTVISLQNNFVVLIGGWNGKKRISAVYIYNIQSKKWTIPTVVGFPKDAGLSSHTSTVVIDDCQSEIAQILIIGREGSLRTHRRYGNAYLLNISLDNFQCVYKNLSNKTASRSGHSTIITKNYTYIIGGRQNLSLEVHGNNWCNANNKTNTFIENNVNINTNHLMKLQDANLKNVHHNTKQPCGRRRQIVVSTNMGLLMYGGETMDGRSRKPVNEIWILTLQNNLNPNDSSKSRLKKSNAFYNCWVRLKHSKLHRASSISCIYENQLYVHGGIDENEKVVCDVHVLRSFVQ